MDDRSRIAVKQAAKEVKRSRDVDIGKVYMSVLMRARRLFEPGPLAGARGARAPMTFASFSTR